MKDASFLLPTHALYSRPDFDQYDRDKEQFIHQMLGDQTNLSIEDKWKALITQFSKVVPSSERVHFESFLEDRLKVAKSNRYVLQLDKTLNYFENFYFLYCNGNPQYRLSDEGKKELLKDIVAGMQPNVCEPGKITQFEDGLQKSRKDNNWVLSELGKHRASIIQRISDEYNQQNKVSDVFSIHTKMHMLKLAKQNGLGVVPLQEVEDLYLAYVNKDSMTAYFEQVYGVKFAEYERDSVENLKQYVMVELIKFFKANHIDLKTWEMHSIAITPAQLDAFHKFIPTIFVNKTPYDFGEYNDAGTAFLLSNKSDLQRSVFCLVQEKLIDEGFFWKFSIDDNQWEKSTLLNEVRWEIGVTAESFTQFVRALQTGGGNGIDLSALILKNKSIITAYPWLIIGFLIQHPDLWLSLPKSVRNNIKFIDAFVESIGQQLLEANSAEEVALVDILSKIIRSNPELLSKLPPQILDKKSFALKLVNQNGLYLRWLSSGLRKDQDVINSACKQNRQAEIYADNYRNSLINQHKFRQKCILPILPPDTMTSLTGSTDIFVSYEKVKNTEILLTKHVISTGTLIRLAQALTPEELSDINQSRLERHLPSLPHCQDNALQQFIADVNNDLWFSSGYLAVKREVSSSPNAAKFGLYLSKDYRRNLANQSIADSDQWILALIAHQKQLPMYRVAFNSLADLMTQLKVSMRASLAFAVSFLVWFKSMFLNLLSAGLAYAACTLFFELYGLLLVASMNFLLANFPVIFSIAPFLVPLVVISAIYVCCFTNLEQFIKTAALVMLIISICAPSAEAIVFGIVSQLLYVALALTFALVLGGLLKVWSIIINDPLTASEIYTQAITALYQVLAMDLLIYISIAIEVISLAKEILFTWPELLFVAVAPWFSRTWATIFATKAPLSKEELIISDVEESILRLQSSSEPSALRKGDLLQELWEQVQADVAAGGVSLNQGLDKKYAIDVSGEKLFMSFVEVAAAPRVDKSEFNPKAPDERYSFFGLRGKTTTYDSIQKHLMEMTDDVPQGVAA